MARTIPVASRQRDAIVRRALEALGAPFAAMRRELRLALAGLPETPLPSQIDRAKSDMAHDARQLGEALTAVGRKGLREGWAAGVDSIDRLFEDETGRSGVPQGHFLRGASRDQAGGAPSRLAPLLRPEGSAPVGQEATLREASGIDGLAVMTDQALRDALSALEGFLVSRLDDVPAKVLKQIESEIRLAALGGQPLMAAMKNVDKLLDGAFDRAKTIVRTEVMRAFSLAAQARALERNQRTPLVKMWRRSGKIHSRLRHDLADGQKVPVDQPFRIGPHPMMHPHDPAAPVAETVNCGCSAKYLRVAYKPTFPDKKPFTEQEIALNPNKAQLAGGATLNELVAALETASVVPTALRTAASEAALALIGRAIHRAQVEHAVFVDAAGNEVLRKAGTRDHVEFTPEELAVIRGTSALHNHPGIGSFSPDDIRFALYHGLADTTVVDWFYRYRIVLKPGGGGDALWVSTIRPLLVKIGPEVNAEFEKAIADGVIDRVQADANYLDEVWRRVCAVAGLSYTRELL